VFNPMTMSPSSGTRSATPGEILGLVRAGKVRTRRDIQDLTGLSRSTLALRMTELTEAGFLRETGLVAGTTGRPAKVLSFDGARQQVIVTALGAARAALAVVDGHGQILASASHEMRVGDGPERVLKRLIRRVADLTDNAVPDMGRVAGVGVSVPGPVSPTTGRPTHPPLMPGWHDFPVAERMSRALGTHVFVENDANLMALGEAREQYPDTPGLLFVTVGVGIGAGLILHGVPERGVAGGAGDIGHVRLSGAAPQLVCTCGSVGCLATQASGGALARKLKEAGRSVETSRDVVEAIAAGDGLAIELVREAGRALGEVLATSVALVNPAVLVLGGEISLAGTYLMDAVSETVHERTVPLVTRGLTIAQSALGADAVIQGARHLVIDQAFSPRAVDQRLAAASP
jgi:predicted NBD/HSP70 family sugar kinase